MALCTLMEWRRPAEVSVSTAASSRHSMSTSRTAAGRRVSAARKSAPRTNTSIGNGSLRESRHAPSPRSRVANVPGKLRRMFGFIASSYREWTRQ